MRGQVLIIYWRDAKEMLRCPKNSSPGEGVIMVKSISIEYCNDWNYYPQAASLAEAIKKKLGVEAKLIKSGGGALEVMADNRLIFSKKKEHRFPQHQEILGKIE